MSNLLQADLYQAVDAFYSKMGGVLTPADKPRLTTLVEERMKPWELDEIIIEMIDGDNPDTPWDESDTLKITIKNGLRTAEVELQWKDAEGNTWVRVDTDGDGE